MSYASVQDMVNWFGEAEMIRASTPDGAAATALVAQTIQDKLDSATSTIDSYLRKRYSVPLDVAPAEINRACCMLARYDLSLGGQRSPSEQAKEARAETIAWLGKIARGEVVLGMEEVAPGDESFATYGTRPQVFQDQWPAGGSCGNGFGGGFFTSGGVPYSSGPL